MATNSRLRSVLNEARPPAERSGSTDGGTADAPESADRANSPSTIGRLLYAGVLALTAVDNVRSLEERVAYADAKNVPAAETAVPLASVLLLAGSAGIALWRSPRAATLSVVTFLVGVTPTMHDFWNHEGEQRETEQFQFLKNVALLGTAVMLYRRATGEDAERAQYESRDGRSETGQASSSRLLRSGD